MLLSEVIPESIKTRVMDFQTCLESIEMSMPSEGFCSTHGESDIAFAIHAPQSYQAESCDSEFVFFLDQKPFVREIGSKGYQIVAEQLTAQLSFNTWAETAIEYVKVTTAGNWPGRDFSDFRRFLKACRSRQLHLSVVDFNWDEPLQLLKQPLADFRTLYLVIVGDAFPDLSYCDALVEKIEAENPRIEALFFGNEMRIGVPCKALLFGELHHCLMG